MHESNEAPSDADQALNQNHDLVHNTTCVPSHRHAVRWHKDERHVNLPNSWCKALGYHTWWCNCDDVSTSAPALRANLQEGRIVGDDVRVPAAVQRVQLRADLLAQLVGLDVERDDLRARRGVCSQGRYTLRMGRP